MALVKLQLGLLIVTWWLSASRVWWDSKKCASCVILKGAGRNQSRGQEGHVLHVLAYYLDMPEKGAVNQSTSGASATNSRLLLTLVYTHLSVFTILAQPLLTNH